MTRSLTDEEFEFLVGQKNGEFYLLDQWEPLSEWLKIEEF